MVLVVLVYSILSPSALSGSGVPPSFWSSQTSHKGLLWVRHKMWRFRFRLGAAGAEVFALLFIDSPLHCDGF